MKILIKVIIAVTFLYLSISLALNGEQSNNRVAEYFFSNWVMGEFFIRFYVLLGVFTSLNVLFGPINRWTKGIMILLFILPIWEGLLYFTGNDTFGLLFTFSKNTAEFIILLLITLISILLVVKLPQIKKSKPFWILFLFLGIGTSFIKPLYIDDWKKSDHDSFLSIGELNEFLNQNTNLEDYKVVAFFTTTCPHCNEAALKMGINQRNNKLAKTLIVFPGIKEDSENFLERNNLKTDYILVSQQTFLKYAGNRFPSIYYFEEDEIFHWIGSEFNFSALNMIVK